MKKRWILAYVLTAAVGIGLHFVYGLFPSPLVGVLAPVNESVWEHLKLLFWPSFGAGLVLARKYNGSRRFWGAWLAGMLLMPALLLGVYYTLAAGFLVESQILDISLFFLSLAAGFFAAWRLNGSGKAEAAAGLLVIAVGMLGAALVLFTAAPPELPVFISKV